jgi:hypothetical protein
MEKVENPTAIRVKNDFSIENILARPDNSENQRRMVRQNPFQNNHVLFYENPINRSSSEINSNVIKSEEKFKTAEDQGETLDSIDNDETNSDVGSDDGNSSVHSEFGS